MILLCANRAGRTRFVSLSAAIAFLAASATASPADIGIAARYPGDKNIGSDPDVILADDFEAYTQPSDLTAKWKVFGAASGNVGISTAEHFAGAKSVEFDLPVSTTEHGYSVNKLLSPGIDTMFCRVYMKWDAGYSVATSNHNGIAMTGGTNPMTGVAPNGSDFFVLLTQNNNIRGEAPPGLVARVCLLAEATATMGRPLVPGRTRFSNHGLPRLQAVAELPAAARPLVLLREDDQAQHAGEERRRSQGVG